MTPSQLSLVVPVWNEEARLKESGAALLDFVARYGATSTLVIADDGSTDATRAVGASLAEDGRCAVRVLSLPHRGKGNALREGVAAATGDVVAFCDVDLATSLEDLARLIEMATQTGALVIGSRDTADARVEQRESRVREFLGKTFNRLVQLLLVRGIRDTQCGAKAATREVWERVLADSAEDGFAWDLEVIALARRRGIAVHEVGVAWSHQPGSRINVAGDGVAMVLAVPRIWRRVRRVR